ncbi:hypothetical protein GUJ93_ZPchr0013g35620 [Zizania palustris]|uniref:Uncharacterized protein n=1 Tax=Zizania palustris TaxID=103762 RepID=A0A8J6BWP9_ZIZPA|nr:hypothetical protein GUJ93_ZPchr0013g35620 [Zizania palustris]
MTVRPGWAVAVARASAVAWQRVAFNPETLPADQVLGLLCCAPLHLLVRIAAFLCVPFLPVLHSRPRFLSARLRDRPRLILLPPPELIVPMYSSSPSHLPHHRMRITTATSTTGRLSVFTSSEMP